MLSPFSAKKTENLRIKLFKQRYTSNIALWLASGAFTAHRTVGHREHLFNLKKPNYLTIFKNSILCFGSYPV